MLEKPLCDDAGNKLTLASVMPGLGVDITLTSTDLQVVRFHADAQSLRTLCTALTAAAQAAERVAKN